MVLCPRLVALTTACLVAATVLIPTSAGAATASSTIVPTHQTAPSGGTVAVGRGTNGANENAQLAETMPATVAPSWRNAPPLAPQSGGVGASSISTTTTLAIVVESQYQASSVSAYALATGALRWRKQYHFTGPATVTAGRVVIEHDDPKTGQERVDALAVDTGKLLWTGGVDSQGPDAVSVGSGVVTKGSSVLSLTTGKWVFSFTPDVGTPGMSLASAGRVFYSSGSGTLAYDTTGKQLWRTAYPAGLTGAWGDDDSLSLAMHGGLLYVPGSKTIVLDPATGRIVRTLPTSSKPIAFDGNVGFFSTEGATTTPATPATVRAIDLRTGATLWTYRLPMKGFRPFEVAGAPLVSNGLVWLTSWSDTGDPTNITALDEVSGLQRSAFVAPCTSGPGSAIVIAQHRLFVSTDCGVQTYLASKTIPVVRRSDEMLPDPGFERGAGGWGALGAGTVRVVSSPTHSGARAITVTPPSATPGAVGFTYPIARNGIRHAWYDATCWVRPGARGMSIAFRAPESAPGDPAVLPTRGWDVQQLTEGVWTQIHTNGYVDESGDSVALQVYTLAASTASGTLTLDDCTVWGTTPKS